MVGYLISFITGAVIGFFGSRLFKGKGVGVVENTLISALAGVAGNYFLIDFFHSFENVLLVNALPAIASSVVILFAVMFIYHHDVGGD